jgi:hypothetical protein
VLPGVWTRLNEICHDLETLFRDAEDFEFTVQSGVLFLLQARRAKRTDWAALAIAVDMVEEGLLTPAKALAHLDGINLDTVVRTSFAPPVPETLAVAEVASMGVASGVVALDSAAVKRLSLTGTHSGDLRSAGDGDNRYRGHDPGSRDPNSFGRANLPRRGGSKTTGQGLPGCLSGSRN